MIDLKEEVILYSTNYRVKVMLYIVLKIDFFNLFRFLGKSCYLILICIGYFLLVVFL